MNTKLSNLLPLLQRFPQNSYLTTIGDRGDEDLRVWVLEEQWAGYYKIDAKDEELPWLLIKEKCSSNYK